MSGHQIDWTKDEVQHLVAMLDDIEFEASPIGQLAAALERIPPPTRRQLWRMRLEEFVEHLRRFPV